jgi:ABC-2 type transport system permease protein
VPQAEMLLQLSMFDFPQVWQTVAYFSGMLLMLPALLIVVLITNEFTFKTHRQNIIDGWSRQDFFKVKISYAFIIAVISTIVMLLTAIVFGALGPAKFSFKGFEHVGYFFIKAFSYNCFATMLGVWIKRSGVAIIVFFVYTIFENGITIALLGWFTDIKSKKGPDLGNLYEMLPMNASDGLISNPFREMRSLAEGVMPKNYDTLLLLVALLYLAIFILFTRRKLLNDDL